MADKTFPKLHDATVFWSTILGFITGALVWLWHVPKRGEDTRQEIVTTGRDMIEHDPVKDSLQAGKELARQHQQVQ